jgi:hypothetical protein
MQTKHQHYRKGVNNQKRADITIDLKRLDKDKMKEWTVEQKLTAKAFIERVSGIFEVFKNEILEAIK